MRFESELKTPQELKDFFLVASQLQKNDFGWQFGQVQDKARTGTSILISYISKHMIKNMKIGHLVEFLTPFLDSDPSMSAIICDAFLELDKTKEAIQHLALKIQEYPMLV